MRQSFKYRLYPNRAQQQMIEDTVEHCRLLYNRLLAERKEAYEKSGLLARAAWTWPVLR